jgi:hypothetical protein
MRRPHRLPRRRPFARQTTAYAEMEEPRGDYISQISSTALH